MIDQQGRKIENYDDPFVVVVLNLLATPIGKHMFLMVFGLRNRTIAQQQNYSYEGATKINLWFGVPKTIRTMCFLVVVTRRLGTIALKKR